MSISKPGSPNAATRNVSPTLLVVAALLLVAGGLAAAAFPAELLLTVGALLLLGGAVGFVAAVYRWPQLALYVLLIFMPLHVFTFLFLETYVSETAAGVFALWKDAALLGGLAVCLVRRKWFRPTPLDLLLLAFLGYQVLMLAVDVNAVTVRGFGINTRYLLVYFLVRCLAPDLAAQKRIVKVLFGALLFIALSGIVIFLVTSPRQFMFFMGYAPTELANAYSGSFPRALSILVSANSLGRTTAMLFLGLLIWYTPQASWVKHGRFLALMLLSLAALILSLSRSAWIGLSVALAAITLLNRRVLTSVVLLGAGALLLLTPTIPITVPYLANSAIAQRLAAILDPQDASTAARVDYLPGQIETIAENPLGIGLGQASRAGRFSDADLDVVYSESVYLQLGLETGIISLGLFLAIVVLTPLTLWQRARRVTGFAKKVCLWAISSLILLFVAALVIPALSAITAVYAWTLAGMAMSLPAAERQ